MVFGGEAIPGYLLYGCDNIKEIHVPWQPDEDVTNWGAANAEIIFKS